MPSLPATAGRQIDTTAPAPAPGAGLQAVTAKKYIFFLKSVDKKY